MLKKVNLAWLEARPLLSLVMMLTTMMMMMAVVMMVGTSSDDNDSGYDEYVSKYADVVLWY